MQAMFEFRKLVVATCAAGAILGLMHLAMVEVAGQSMIMNVESPDNEATIEVGAPYADPTVTGTNYGNLYLFSSDALAANKGGVMTFGAVTTSAGADSRMAAIKGAKETASTWYGGYLAFYTRIWDKHYLTERMRIDSNGAVGIGVSAPGADTILNVTANISGGYAAKFINNGNNTDRRGISIRSGDSSTGTNSYPIDFYNGSGTYWGSVVLTASNNISFGIRSDERLKEKIRLSEMDGLDLICRMPVKDFSYIGTGVDTTGFVAQDLEKVYPRSVVERVNYKEVSVVEKVMLPAGAEYNGRILDAPLAVDVTTTRMVEDGSHKMVLPMELIPVIVQAVQKQQEEIVGLQGQLEKLEWTLKECGIRYDEKAGLQLDSVFVDNLILALEQNTSESADLVEIPFDQAWESVAEVAQKVVMRNVIKYEINWNTMVVEAVERHEEQIEEVPTGRTIKQLREGVVFDAETGKCLIRKDGDGVDVRTRYETSSLLKVDKEMVNLVIAALSGGWAKQ